ncbi:MAG: heme exporter protein CcmD [Betaproteobacteria bacterium HGW-Betaproteobacteria-11]|nr:MAG: heme exporter protein CcmD [Betaproteobacteria bacterium HGW-Betaproteobacteria-11]
MQWTSAAEFFAMGGYGLYVWGSFGVCALTLAIEPLLARRRLKAIRQSIRRERLADQLDNESR